MPPTPKAKPAPKPGKPPKVKGKKKLPKWAIPVALVGAIAVWYFFLRGRSSAGTGGAPYTSQPLSPQDAASAGQPSTNSSPAASLDPALLGSMTGPLAATDSFTGSGGSRNDNQDVQIAALADQLASLTLTGAGMGAADHSGASVNGATGGTNKKAAAHVVPKGSRIVSTKRLANGSVVRTYSTGVKTQQFKGGTAYRIFTPGKAVKPAPKKPAPKKPAPKKPVAKKPVRR